MKLPFPIASRAIQGNFDALVAALFGLSLRVGKATATFTASSNSAQVTIPHGLGKVPRAVFGMPTQPVNGRVHIQESTAPDVMNIYLSGYQSADIAITITQDFYWIALG